MSDNIENASDDLVSLSDLEKGYIKIKDLNSVCFMVSKPLFWMSDDLALFEMGEAYLIANKALDKSIELPLEEWEYFTITTRDDSQRYGFSYKKLRNTYMLGSILDGIKNMDVPNCLIINNDDWSVHKVINLDTFEYDDILVRELNIQRSNRIYMQKIFRNEAYFERQVKILKIITVAAIIGAIVIKWLI